MALRQILSARFSATLTSPALARLRESGHERLRRLRRAPLVIDWVHQADDPYSHLLAQALPNLLASYDVALRFRLVPPPDRAGAPEPEMLRQYGLRDAKWLAQGQGLELPPDATLPTAERVAWANRRLAVLGEESVRPEDVVTIGAELWRKGAGEDGGRLADEATAAAVIERNRHWRERAGHYLGAMLRYGGVWYWGADRVAHLAERLDRIGVRRPGAPGLVRTAHRTVALPAVSGPLEVFFSFRSPYSAIAMDRVFQLARAHGVALSLKPVLPMVMRGLPVPLAKRLYILLDTKREADRLGIPFGRLIDPVGAGAERCLAVTCRLGDSALAEAFIASAMSGIWAEGIDVATDDGLRRVAERAGVGADDLAAALADDGWRKTVAANREEMFATGLWGVPSFRLGELAVWGQDRVWLVEQGLRKLTTPEQ